MNTNVYIGGHAFEVDFEYTPEIKVTFGRDGGEPHEDEKLEINSIYLGDDNVTTILIEEAPALSDKIEAQVLESIKEGEDEG